MERGDVYEVAWAAGSDAANRRMRKGKRIAWSRSDYNAAIAEYNRVIRATVDSNQAALRAEGS